MNFTVYEIFINNTFEHVLCPTTVDKPGIQDFLLCWLTTLVIKNRHYEVY